MNNTNNINITKNDGKTEPYTSCFDIRHPRFLIQYIVSVHDERRLPLPYLHWATL